MFFVQARWFGRNKGVADGIRYISHREERLPGGKTRELIRAGATRPIRRRLPEGGCPQGSTPF